MPSTDDDDPYRDRYGAEDSLYGDLDIDRVLAEARPRMPFGAWRRGDVVSRLGRTAKSSGLTIAICEDRENVERDGRVGCRSGRGRPSQSRARRTLTHQP